MSKVKIKIFGKQDCDACKSTKEKFNIFLDKWEKKSEVEMEFFDLDTFEGLTEAAMQDATEVPTTIIEKDGLEIGRWQKQVPLSKDFKELFV